MDRYWLLTWTTYGTWLPGDSRGFVSNVADNDGHGTRHNGPDTPYSADARGLRSFAAERLIREPVRLTRAQATGLVDQFRETAGFRGWELRAAAVMGNHVHLVVGVAGDPEPDDLLRDFKSYGSRKLNQAFGCRARWWTQSGSKRKLPNEAAVVAAVEYVRNQEFPLLVWIPTESDAPGERPASASCTERA